MTKLEKGKNSDKFKILFDAVYDAIFVHDLEGNILEVNEVAAKRLGYPKAELLKMNLKDIDSPEHKAKIEEKIKILKEQGEAILETAHLTKKGLEIPVELSSKIINFEGKEAVLSVARDLSDRRRVSQIRRYSKELLDFVPSAVFTVDNDKKITSWNKAAEKITGFLAEEMIGKDCATFALSPCNEKCGLLDKETKKPLFSKNCIIKNKQGQEIKISKNVGEVKDDDGKVIGGIESFEDVSRSIEIQKKLEEKLEEMEKLNKIMMGRELKMIELKEENEKLRRKLKN